MGTRTAKKLDVRKQTLRTLESSSLRRAAGGEDGAAGAKRDDGPINPSRGRGTVVG